MSLRIRPARFLPSVAVVAFIAAGCAPLPYSLNFAKDNIIGIDVALESEVLPDTQAGVSRSRITLVRHFVRASEVHEVAAAIGTVMASTNLTNLRLRATGTREETRNGATSTALVLDPSQELRRLEEKVVGALHIFRSNPIDAREYVVTPEGARMSDDRIEAVEQFVPAESGVNYRPFLLVDPSQAEAAKKSANQITVRAVGVSIYQLGAQSTADRMLWTWTGEPGAR
jgi:hypothetical protein